MVSIVVDIGVEICIDTDKRNCGSNTRKLPIDIILSNSEFNCSLTFEGGVNHLLLGGWSVSLVFYIFLGLCHWTKCSRWSLYHEWFSSWRKMIKLLTSSRDQLSMILWPLISGVNTRDNSCIVHFLDEPWFQIILGKPESNWFPGELLI